MSKYSIENLYNTFYELGLTMISGGDHCTNTSTPSILKVITNPSFRGGISLDDSIDRLHREILRKQTRFVLLRKEDYISSIIEAATNRKGLRLIDD